MNKLKFWEKNFWQWPEMRFGRCLQVIGVTKLVTSTIGNRGRKICCFKKWVISWNNSQAWKKKMKIRNLTIRDDNPWPVTRTWSQWHGDTPVKEWTSEANKYKRKLRKKKVLKGERGNLCWWWQGCLALMKYCD